MGRYVVTGGPGNGKTTTCFEFFKDGYLIGPESARPIIKEQQQFGDSGILPWTNLAAFQLYVLQRQLDIEDRISGEALFDRGIYDNIAYCRLGEIMVPSPLEKAASDTRYDGVFILDPLPFYDRDSERREDPREAERIHKAIVKTYNDYSFGPRMWKIPALDSGGNLYTPKERQGIMKERIAGA